MNKFKVYILHTEVHVAKKNLDRKSIYSILLIMMYIGYAMLQLTVAAIQLSSSSDIHVHVDVT